MTDCSVIDVTGDFTSARQINPRTQTNAQLVGYELPLTLDEALAIYFLEVAAESPLDQLRMHVMNLNGVRLMFAGQLVEAEESLKEALQVRFDSLLN
jgi:hypothetical protein